MSTIARKIDALGGPAIDDWSRGYTAAREAAGLIAELADAQIDELIEMVSDVLNGTQGDLAKWAEYARRTVNGIKAERDR